MMDFELDADELLLLLDALEEFIDTAPSEEVPPMQRLYDKMTQAYNELVDIEQ